MKSRGLGDVYKRQDAVLAASVFHFGPDHAIEDVKNALRAAGHEVR